MISSPRRIPKHIAGDRSFVFEADTHALRKRLPPKQAVRVGGNSKRGNRLESHFPIVSELPDHSSTTLSFASHNPISGPFQSSRHLDTAAARGTWKGGAGRGRTAEIFAF